MIAGHPGFPLTHNRGEPKIFFSSACLRARTGGAALRPPISLQTLPVATGYKQLHAILSLVPGYSRVQEACCHLFHCLCFLLSSGIALHFPYSFVNIRCQCFDLLCHRERPVLLRDAAEVVVLRNRVLMGSLQGAQRLEDTKCSSLIAHLTTSLAGTLSHVPDRMESEKVLVGDHAGPFRISNRPMTLVSGSVKVKPRILNFAALNNGYHIRAISQTID